jgi:hypothetical protein
MVNLHARICIVQPVKSSHYFRQPQILTGFTFDGDGGGGVWWHAVDDFPTVKATRPGVKYALKSGNSKSNFLRKAHSTDDKI